MTDATGKQITYSHNDAANEDLVTDRLSGNQTRVQYDATGNIVRKEASVTIEGVLVNAVTTATYDAMGNETTTVDPDGRKSAATYSGSCRSPACAIQKINLATSFAYNARNDLTQATDAAGRSFTFSYDSNGNPIGANLPNAGSVSVVNDARGDPIDFQDAAGTRTVLTRDAGGRITREEVFGSGTVLLRRIDTTWDANGSRKAKRFIARLMAYRRR